ncbi:hypothetical protein SKAU_G00025300 [Synaphobranchus kaupii]|uniref:Reelin n=1 Tax=Synaphobranchus kaupii TaxID=118154 RepID=A0A9Q1GEH9_SYNKA|nr:hypothetical protein SKAU_G00025300 [Synaphobranchus kaupii]
MARASFGGALSCALLALALGSGMDLGSPPSGFYPRFNPFFFLCTHHGDMEGAGMAEGGGEVLLTLQIAGNPAAYTPGQEYQDIATRHQRPYRRAVTPNSAAAPPGFPRCVNVLVLSAGARRARGGVPGPAGVLRVTRGSETAAGFRRWSGTLRLMTPGFHGGLTDKFERHGQVLLRGEKQGSAPGLTADRGKSDICPGSPSIPAP